MRESKNDGVWTPANKVTMARIFLIPVFVAVLVAPWPQYFPDWPAITAAKPWLAAAVFIVLSLTDTLDGYLARSRGEVTDFGKFLDPLADKLLVTAALLCLIELDVLPSWVALVIISREFIVSGVRMIAASKGQVIAASWYGKVKTVLQMVAIVLFIIKDSHVVVDFNALAHDWMYLFSWFVMGGAIVMTIVSMIDYLYKSRYLLGFSAENTKQDLSDSAATAAETKLDKAESSIPHTTVPSWTEITELAESVLDSARSRSVTIATAESCTGGLIAGSLTSIAGSSDVVLGGFVTYSNNMKHTILGVSSDSLRSYGAVSREVACEMAQGALQRSGAQIAVSVTGIAGPGGGEPGKPVGTVWIGCANEEGVQAQLFCFDGGRDDIRLFTVKESLRIAKDAIEKVSPNLSA